MVVKTSSKLRRHDGGYLEDDPCNYIGRMRDGYTGILHHASQEEKRICSDSTDWWYIYRDNSLYRVPGDRVFVKRMVWLEAYEAHLLTGQPLWHEIDKEKLFEMCNKVPKLSSET